MNLKKPLMFICKQNIIFIIHVLLEIWQRYCKLLVLSRHTKGKNQMWYYQNFRVYLPAKNKRHQIQKTLFWGHLSKNKFFWEKELRRSLNIPIIYYCAKNEKNLMSHSWEKCRTDELMLRKSMDWFLYDIGLRYERVKYVRLFGENQALKS